MGFYHRCSLLTTSIHLKATEAGLRLKDLRTLWVGRIRHQQRHQQGMRRCQRPPLLPQMQPRWMSMANRLIPGGVLRNLGNREIHLGEAFTFAWDHGFVDLRALVIVGRSTIVTPPICSQSFLEASKIFFLISCLRSSRLAPQNDATHKGNASSFKHTKIPLSCCCAPKVGISSKLYDCGLVFGLTCTRLLNCLYRC